MTDISREEVEALVSKLRLSVVSMESEHMQAALIRNFLASRPAHADRAARQAVVIEWGRKCFGADHMADKVVRAARFFEEAAELVQAVGLSKDHALRAFEHVYGRAAGNIAQEVGGVAVTLMALCDALRLSVDECEATEIARCLSKSPETFAARNKNKIAEVDTPRPADPAPASAEGWQHDLTVIEEVLGSVDGTEDINGDVWDFPDAFNSLAAIRLHLAPASPLGQEWRDMLALLREVDAMCDGLADDGCFNEVRRKTWTRVCEKIEKIETLTSALEPGGSK